MKKGEHSILNKKLLLGYLGVSLHQHQGTWGYFIWEELGTRGQFSARHFECLCWHSFKFLHAVLLNFPKKQLKNLHSRVVTFPGSHSQEGSHWASHLSLAVAFCFWVARQPPFSEFLSLGGGILMVLSSAPRDGSMREPTFILASRAFSELMDGALGEVFKARSSHWLAGTPRLSFSDWMGVEMTFQASSSLA